MFMNQKIQFIIKGIPELKAMLKRKDELAMQKAREALMKTGQYMMDQIKLSINNGVNAAQAVKTGKFRDSTKWIVKDFTAIIYNDVPYAHTIEYRGWSPNNPARPHFRNTLFVEKDNITKYFKNKIKEI